MKNFILFTFSCFLISTGSFAQTETENPIEDQFTELIESSNTFKEYKVVNFNELRALQNETSSYIEELKKEIELSENSAQAQKEELSNLEAELASINSQLEELKVEKDSIDFLGMPVDKSTHKTIMWGIIGLLVLALVFFVYSFRKGHSTTKEARRRMEETEKEFEAYRAKSLEKEQRLGRMLQDERNKNSHKSL